MKLLTSLLFILCTLAAYSSDEIPRSARKAEGYFIEYDYFEALDAYKKALEKDVNHPFILRRIADCYRFMGIPSEAKEWYKKSIEMGPLDALDYYYCSEVHRSLGEYETANYWIMRYAELVPQDTRTRRLKQDPDYYKQLEVDDHKYLVDNFEVNDHRAVLPPTASNELLILPIASEVNEGWFPHKRFLMDYDLYQTSVDDQFNLVSAEPLRGEINTRFLEGPSAYDKEREVLYVTRFLTRKQKPGLDERGDVFSMIQSFKLIDGYWLEVDMFPHNSELRSCAYPTLSPDGEQLIFSSNRRGGTGAMDLYICDWSEEEQRWEEPRSMGALNTEGNEIYPGFAPDGRFVFASDGHPSLGGLDIFFVDLTSYPLHVENPGIPVNSRYDDFGLVHMGDEFGYFCSDRETEIGGDDLFWWEEMHEVIEADIVLMDAAGNPLYPERVSIRNLRTEEQYFKSGIRGNFTASLNGKDRYEIVWNQDGEVIKMHCTPEVTPYGLRYTYDSPQKNTFLADAKVESYKEGSFRKKKVPFKSWHAKNLTNHLEYPSSADSGKGQYLAATWSGAQGQPTENTRVYLKDMETGRVQTFTATPSGVEFEVVPDHMHAMMWLDESNQPITRYLVQKEDESGSTAMDFVGTPEQWSLALSESPIMDTNKDGERMLVAALMASNEGGMIAAEDAGELALYVEDGRKVSVEGTNTRIHAENVYFGFDKSSLQAREKEKLEALADQLHRLDGAKTEIIAHTDARGSKSYNRKLSEMRAEETRQALLKLGVNDAQISIQWKGEEELVNNCFDGVPCSSKQHRLNRRAEVHLILPKESVFPGK